MKEAEKQSVWLLLPFSPSPVHVPIPLLPLPPVPFDRAAQLKSSTQGCLYKPEGPAPWDTDKCRGRRREQGWGPQAQDGTL